MSRASPAGSGRGVSSAPDVRVVPRASERADGSTENAARSVPAPVSRRLQAQFGNAEVMAALQGGGGVPPHLLADPMRLEADGSGEMAQPLLSNASVQRALENGASQGAPPDLPGTGAPGWLVSAVALLSPPLADILERGVVGAFREDFEGAVSDWVATTFADPSPEGIADTLTGTLWQVSGIIGGVASGDPMCCTAMAGWVSGTLAQADALLRSDTQLARISADQSGKWTAALQQLGALVDTDQLMALVSGVIDAVARDVGALVDALSALDGTLGRQVAEFLGVDAGSLSELVAEGVAALFAHVGSAVADAKAGLLDALFSLPGMTQLGELADFAVEMRQGVAWLAENWQAADLWERSGELASHLPRFAALLTAGGRGGRGSRRAYRRSSPRPARSSTGCVSGGWASRCSLRCSTPSPRRSTASARSSTRRCGPRSRRRRVRAPRSRVACFRSCCSSPTACPRRWRSRPPCWG